MIILISLIPLSIGIKKLVEYIITIKKREKVRRLLDKEVNKKIIYSPSKILKTLNQIMTPKYFANVFYKQYLPVSRYNMNERLSLKKYLKLETSPMESNYYFNMCKNNLANNFFMKESIPKKYYNNFIFPELTKLLDKEIKQGYPKNIINIEIISIGDSLLLPTQFFKNDVFIYSLKGNAYIQHTPPSVASELDPYTCFPFFRKRIEDIETKIGMTELREGDFIYIPNGTVIEISFKNNFPNQILVIIEFDNFLKNDKMDNEIELIKLEQLQLRKIPRKVYPKNILPDELEILWIKKIINGNNWEKNQVFSNPI